MGIPHASMKPMCGLVYRWVSFHHDIEAERSRARPNPFLRRQRRCPFEKCDRHVAEGYAMMEELETTSRLYALVARVSSEENRHLRRAFM